MTNQLTAPDAALPELPDQFITAALAYPDKVKDHLPAVYDAEDAQHMLEQGQAMHQYARLIGNTRAANAIVYGNLMIKAHIGKLCPPAKRGRGNKKSCSGVTNLGNKTVAEYRKIANHEGKLDGYKLAIDSVTEDDPREMSQKGFLDYVGAGGVLATRHNNDVVDWYTPPEYIEAARSLMGSIDLDPATSSHAQKVVKAETFYTQDDDGLAHDWSGNVFMNPPFKMPLVEQFVFKLCDSFEAKDVPQAVLLTNNATDPKWWQRAASMAAVICFTAGRIKFYNRAGEFSSPTNGQTIMYFGGRRASARKLLGAFGITLEPCQQ